MPYKNIEMRRRVAREGMRKFRKRAKLFDLLLESWIAFCNKGDKVKLLLVYVDKPTSFPKIVPVPVNDEDMLRRTMKRHNFPYSVSIAEKKFVIECVEGPTRWHETLTAKEREVLRSDWFSEWLFKGEEEKPHEP